MPLILLAATLAGPAVAQETTYVTSSTLRAAGMDMLSLTFAAVTSDGTAIGYDRPPLEEKMKGAKFRLWFVKPASDGRLADARAVPLDIGSLDQLALTPDDQAVVVIASQGADFFRLSLKDGSGVKLMEHRPGTPGFRTLPLTLFRGQDRMVTTGFFYDAADVGGESVVATFNPYQQGVEAFQAGPNFDAVERQLENLYGSVYAQPDLMFFSTQDKLRARVYSWTPTQGLKQVDEGKKQTGGWGEGRALVYGMNDAQGSSQLVLVDGPDTRRLLAADPERTFYNVCVSPGAQTVLSELGGKDRVALVAATAEGGWKVSPIPGLESTAPGIVRLSVDGSVGLFYNPTGLRLIRF